MRHEKITAFDCPDAWFKTLKAIYEKGDLFKVEYGSEETETKKLNLTIEIDHPETRPLVSDKAPCDIRYIRGYSLEFLWTGEKQDETYTYGSRINDPVDQIEEGLKRYSLKKGDRQVTMEVGRPEDIKKELAGRRHEPPCLRLIDTEILEGKMNMIFYFRSWDAYAGLPANIAGLQMFNEAFVSSLNDRINESIQTGKLIFHSKNCHIYERQNKFVEELLHPQSGKTFSQKMKQMGSSS